MKYPDELGFCEKLHKMESRQIASLANLTTTLEAPAANLFDCLRLFASQAGALWESVALAQAGRAWDRRERGPMPSTRGR